MMRGTPARRFHGDDIAMRGPPPVSIDLDTSSPRAAPRRVKSASPSERFEETRHRRCAYRTAFLSDRLSIMSVTGPYIRYIKLYSSDSE